MKLIEVSTGKEALVKKVAYDIQRLMEGVAAELQKALRDLEGGSTRSPRPFRVDLHKFPEGFHGWSIHLMKHEEVSRDTWQELQDTIKETLEDEGYINGILPVDVKLTFYLGFATIAVR